MPPIVRFAPSPTGRIHIGNARTALFNFLFAKKHRGRFILRFDDTDLARSREEYVTSIVQDLDWLGIAPDVTVRQSQRFSLYDAAAAKLRSAGRLYPCYETAEELERRRKRQQARGLPPVYDRAALALTAAERAELEAAGRRPHWRFLLNHAVIRWDDLIRGASHIEAASLSDPVLIREDETYLYTLPSVVDDIGLGISHVIRGEDHVTNTAVQIQLFEALGSAPPVFGHHNLLTTSAGEGLSKRSGALSIGGLRDAGIEALAVAACAVLTGTAESLHPVASLDALAANLDLSRVGRASARFDPAELEALSTRTLHQMEFASVAERLAAAGVSGEMAQPFWAAVRANLEKFSDVADWWTVAAGEIVPKIEDDDYVAAARQALPQEPWDQTTWAQWTNFLKAATGRKGRSLYHPLRLALTGREQGPELAQLLPLIGFPKAQARLSGHVA